jgi:hypothetical protein
MIEIHALFDEEPPHLTHARVPTYLHCVVQSRFRLVGRPSHASLNVRVSL